VVNLLHLLADSDTDELVRLGHTLDRWHSPIVASFELGITNACTEGLNRKIKHVKRTGCGFRNPKNYRTSSCTAADTHDTHHPVG
jgi:transposase